MRPVQARFVTACQQLLALGVVLAVITPAASVLSLDIVGAPSRPGGSPAPLSGALSSATVPTSTVEPEVTEVPLTSLAGSARALTGSTVQRQSLSATTVTSRPQVVTGYGAVGVTWAGGQDVAEDGIEIQVRTREGDEWTDWSPLEYHDDHAPDAGTAEARNARPGTDPLIVGDVDSVQVKAAVDTSSTAVLPSDLTLAVIAPGTAEETEKQAPAEGPSPEEEFEERSEGAISLRSAATTPPMPTIYSRAQWGANESLRNKSALRYGTVSAGFVHHTVNANDYTEAQVPGILRSIYAYHVQSRGWSDIGYNFLVDRFGRIWEGRYGGVDKNVVGAHTLGYNDYAFAMSAIGNFDVVAAPDVMLRSYGALFEWKLALNGVNPDSMSQQVGRSTFAAINGHRDAGSTACPGRYLYAKLATIRSYASSAAPAPPPAPVPAPPLEITDPAPQSNLVGAGYPELVVRRASDGQGLILPTGGLTSFSKATVVSRKGWSNRPEVLITPDVTGDGVLDLVSTSEQGVLRIRPGKGNGKFKATSKVITATEGHTLMTAVGDINKDGRNDLVARYKGRMVALLGTPKGGFKRSILAKGMGSYTQFIGVGDQNSDGSPDLVARDTKGRLFQFAGTGTGTFGGRTAVPGSWSAYNRVTGGADVNGDGRGDLVARTPKGKVFIHTAHGDGSYSLAMGPAANVRALRSLTSAGNLVGDAAPDMIGVKDNDLVVVPNKGTFDLGAPIDTGVSFAGATSIINAGDWDRDGAGDVITRAADGSLLLYRGNNLGRLAAPSPLGTGFSAVEGLTAAGDVTGDGFPDLLGTLSGALNVFAGTGTAISAGRTVAGRTVARTGLPADLTPFDWVVPVSDIKAKGTGDYLVRQPSTGYLYVYTGTRSGVAPPRLLGEGLGAYDLAG
ncbi:MAG: N-acetylmuramoyl-L-alanine amidase, family 2 [Nocardioides sp.]|uniref:FG-GAP-like repeat-containing protein n=1 Tax=Nocardioides sp. TaxID=35761 RepID=UPI00260DBB03|nr:FG-GAP-like repeat-containing protein [Nocardioides sp.]MCW2835535.1 N-acetylmuramoyl-L-alanine amidase, family 2 [Nocardioides sp.]